MQKEWSPFRITAILYVIVLLILMGFYFVNNSFETMKEDTKIIRQSSQLAGNIEHYSLNRVNPQTPNGQIDAAMSNLSAWVKQNSHSEYYIGGATLLEDFQNVEKCWDGYKKSIGTNENETAKCYETVDSLALTIEKMVYLKQKRIINIFYGSLFLTMALLLLAIYLVRVYIEQQLRKNSIYDLPTKLFNQNYFLSTLKNNSAKSIRHKHPLYMTSLLAEESGDAEQKSDSSSDALLSVLGGLITSVVRESDTPCYWGENLFMILLTDTDEDGAHIFEKRLRQKLETHDFMTAKPLRFRFATIQYDGMEKTEAFVARAKTLLI
jgi:GGDEF domain-containing protein